MAIIRKNEHNADAWKVCFSLNIYVIYLCYDQILLIYIPIHTKLLPVYKDCTENEKKCSEVCHSWHTLLHGIINRLKTNVLFNVLLQLQ